MLAPLVTAIREPQMGGSQALVADLSRALTLRGYEVRLYASSGSAVEGVEVVDLGVDPADLQEALFRPGHDADTSAVTQAAFAKAYAMIASDGADVVHNHAFDAPAFDAAWEAAPIVHTLHLPPAPSVAAAVRAASAAGSTVVVVSRSQSVVWRPWLAAEPVLVRNGVPTDQIPYSATAPMKALFAGRFSPEKGALDAIEICSRAGLDMTLVGSDYDNEYALKVRRNAEAAGAEVLGTLPRNTLWSLMAESAAVVCPIHWEEPFGLVAAEAQAAGTPVVAYARGGLPEIVLDGKTGACVEPRDMDAATLALRNVDRYDRATCRQNAQENLSLDGMISRYEQVYESAMRRRA